MRHVLSFALILSVLLTACTRGWDMPPLVIGPSEPGGDGDGPGIAVVLPEGPAASHGFGLAWNPVTRLDPFTEKDTLNVHLTGLLYQGLFAVDAAFEPQTQLCAALETEDNRRFTLRLRGGAVFSDGQPLTADDVAYSFTQARASGSVYAKRLSVVHTVSAQADGSVRVELSAPRARFAALLGFPIVRKGGDTPAMAPTGTGPYVLGRDDDGYPVLAPNPYHPDADRLQPSRISLLDARDPVNLGFYFQYRHISAIAYDFNDPSQPGIHSGCERYDYPGATLQYIGVSAASGPLTQPEVRRAVSMALDRAALCEDLFNDAGPSVLPVPPSGALYDAEAGNGYGYDPIAALRLLGEAGCVDSSSDGVLEWPEGRRTLPLRFTMLTNAEASARTEAARRLSASLADIGIELTVVTLPWDEYLAAVSKGTYDLYWAQASLTPDFDLGVFLDDSGALRVRGGAASAETVQALAAVRSAVGEDESAAARRELYRCWLEHERVIAVCFNTKSLLTQRGLFAEPTPASEDVFYGFAEWGIR